MKTDAGEDTPCVAAPILRLIDVGANVPATPADPARARASAEPLTTGRLLDSGEDMLAHADAVSAILRAIGASPALQAAAYLVYAADHLGRPDEVIAKAFGESQ